MDGGGERVGRRRGEVGRLGDQAVLGERVGERAFLVEALDDQAIGVLEVDHGEAQALGDVGARPPAGERRQIVGRDAGDRQGRIVLGRA